MRLVKITDTLWINPAQVSSVEERTIDHSDGPYTFVELTLESMIRWKLDVPLDQVVKAVDRLADVEEMR